MHDIEAQFVSRQILLFTHCAVKNIKLIETTAASGNKPACPFLHNMREQISKQQNKLLMIISF